MPQSRSLNARLRDHLFQIRGAMRDLRLHRGSHDLSRETLPSAPTAHGRPHVTIRSMLHEVERDILPRLRADADPMALILPTAVEWVGWESLRIIDTDAEFMAHVHDLAYAGLDGALLVLLGMLGPHLRQQSDEVDRAILPLLLRVALQRLRRALLRADLVIARRLVGIIFNALHFNPDYSLARDRVRQRIPYDLAIY